MLNQISSINSQLNWWIIKFNITSIKWFSEEFFLRFLKRSKNQRRNKFYFSAFFRAGVIYLKFKLKAIRVMWDRNWGNWWKGIYSKFKLFGQYPIEKDANGATKHIYKRLQFLMKPFVILKTNKMEKTDKKSMIHLKNSLQKT